MKNHLTHPLVWMCALAGAMAATTAQAANEDARQQYEADKAWCDSGQSTQPRALCLREAARADAEARRGRLEPLDTMEPTSAGPTSDRARQEQQRTRPPTGSTPDSGRTLPSNPTPPSNQTQQ